jgi:arylsulfatase A-like enzyme
MTTSEEVDAAPAFHSEPPVEARARFLVGPAALAFAGWVVVALDNLIHIVALPSHRVGVGVRLLHAAFDLGQTLAIGLVLAAAVALFDRFAPKRTFLPYLVVTLGSVLLFQLLLPSDLEGAIDRWTESEGGELLVRLLSAGLALSIPALFFVGRLLARPRFRLLGLLAGTALIAANDYVLVNGYPGGHFWIAASGATLVSASLSGLPLGAWAGHLAEPRPLRLGLAALVLGALLSIALEPPSRVGVALLERDTAYLAPTLTSFRAHSDDEQVRVPPELRPWFASRTHLPPVAPSTDRLVSGPPIVILVTIDALRYDVLAEKNARFAPTLHDIAEQGVTFTQARSSGSDTRYALAALFAGRFYSMVKWTGFGRPRPTLESDLLPRFPELLTARGVKTVTAHPLPHILGPPVGILRGFSAEFTKDDSERDPATPALIDQTIKQLKRAGDAPLFCYLHLLDPHGPYSKHGKRVSGRQAYLAEVSFADEHIGRLRKAIRKYGLEQRTVLIVSADHGEAFGEHGLTKHNQPLYEVMVHVPLLVEYAGVAPRTIDRHVSTMDIGPTVLDVFGVPTPGNWMAESLVPVLKGKAAPSARPIFMERRRERALVFSDGIKAMVRENPYTEQIYDLRRDPDEEEDLREELGKKGDERIGLVRTFSARHSWVNGAPPDAD